MHLRFFFCSKHSGKCSLFWFHESENWNWQSLSRACPDSLWPHGIVHGILQARILEWVVCFLLLGIFPTQGSNPGLLNCRGILYQLNHQESPRILEWVAYPFGSSWPRNQTGVSCIAGRLITNWVIRRAKTLARVTTPNSWASSWGNAQLLHWQESCCFFFPSLKTIAPTWQAQAEGRAWKLPAEEDGVWTHACRAQWISSPAPWPLGHLALIILNSLGFLGSSAGKESAHNAGDPGSIPGLGRFPGEGKGNPFQYSCLENPMDYMRSQGVKHNWATFTFKSIWPFPTLKMAGI